MSSATAVQSDQVRLIGVGGVRSVSESSFDALHTEMVHYLALQIANQHKRYDSTTRHHAAHLPPLTHPRIRVRVCQPVARW